MTGSSEILDNQPMAKFLCGVVEGKLFQNGGRFHGKPPRMAANILT